MIHRVHSRLVVGVIKCLYGEVYRVRDLPLGDQSPEKLIAFWPTMNAGIRKKGLDVSLNSGPTNEVAVISVIFDDAVEALGRKNSH